MSGFWRMDLASVWVPSAGGALDALERAFPRGELAIAPDREGGFRIWILAELRERDRLTEAKVRAALPSGLRRKAKIIVGREEEKDED